MAAKPQSGDEETQTTHCQPRAVLAFGMVIDHGVYLSWPRPRFAAEVLDLACLDRAAWGLPKSGPAQVHARIRFHLLGSK